MLHLREGTEKGLTTVRTEKKKPSSGGIQTHDLAHPRRVLYRCATTTAPDPLLLNADWPGQNWHPLTVLITSLYVAF